MPFNIHIGTILLGTISYPLTHINLHIKYGMPYKESGEIRNIPLQEAKFGTHDKTMRQNWAHISDLYKV